jgi:hypothetical protein
MTNMFAESERDWFGTKNDRAAAFVTMPTTFVIPAVI